MSCQDCERTFDEVMDFLVADPIWNYVMGGVEKTTYKIREGLFDKRLMARSEGVGGIVCLACFDKRARDLGIEYREHVLVFGVDCWMGSHYNDGMPLVSPGTAEVVPRHLFDDGPMLGPAVLDTETAHS